MPDENVYTEAHGFKFPNGTTIPIEDAEARESISEINQSLSQLPILHGYQDITSEISTSTPYTATENCVVMLTVANNNANAKAYLNAYVNTIPIGMTFPSNGVGTIRAYAFMRVGDILTLNSSFPYEGTFSATLV